MTDFTNKKDASPVRNAPCSILIEHCNHNLLCRPAHPLSQQVAFDRIGCVKALYTKVLITSSLEAGK